MKVQKLKNGQYFIYLPMKVVKEKGLNVGDNINIEVI